MTYLILTTMITTALSLYFSHDEYKKGGMSTRNFRIICVCDGIAFIGLLYLFLLK